MIHTLVSRSTSSHVAPVASKVRTPAKNCKLQRPSIRRIALTSLDHEGRQLSMGQGGMVFSAPGAFSFGLPLDGEFRKKLVEMAAPTCRVVALPISSNGRPVEDGFDPASPLI